MSHTRVLQWGKFLVAQKKDSLSGIQERFSHTLQEMFEYGVSTLLPLLPPSLLPPLSAPLAHLLQTYFGVSSLLQPGVLATSSDKTQASDEAWEKFREAGIDEKWILSQRQETDWNSFLAAPQERADFVEAYQKLGIVKVVFVNSPVQKIVLLRGMNASDQVIYTDSVPSSSSSPKKTLVQRLLIAAAARKG